MSNPTASICTAALDYFVTSERGEADHDATCILEAAEVQTRPDGFRAALTTRVRSKGPQNSTLTLANMDLL
jgi:hypothetical protein